MNRIMSGAVAVSAAFSLTSARAYTPVDYVEATGSQAVDTGFFVTPRTRITADFAYTAKTIQQRVFGAAADTASPALSCALYINGSSKFAWAMQDGKGNWATTEVAIDTARHQFVLDSVNNEYVLATGTVTNKTAALGTARTKTAVWPLAIFANRNSDTKTLAFNNYGKVKLYGFIIETNSVENGWVKVMDLKPVRAGSGAIGGLYDEVNGRLLMPVVGELDIPADQKLAATTWIGGAAGDWDDEKNWDNGLPGGEKYANFTTACTVTSQNPVALGADGIRIHAAANVDSHVIFTGKGDIHKSGTGVMTLSESSEHEGDFYFEGGTLKVAAVGALGGSSGKLRVVSGTELYINCAGPLENDIVYDNGVKTYWHGGGNLSVEGTISGPGGDMHWLQNSSSKTPVEFRGEITLPNAVVTMTPYAQNKGYFKFYAPVHLKGFSSDTTAHGNVMFCTTGNTWQSFFISYIYLLCGCENCFDPTTVIDYSGLQEDGRGTITLQTYSQVIDRITGKSSSMSYVLKSSGDVNLLMRATKSDTTWCEVDGKVSLIYDAKDPSCVQTFMNRTHGTSGAIVVSNGTFKVGGTATFKNVPSVTVCDGATFLYDSTAAAGLSGVTRVAVGKGGTFKSSTVADALATGSVAFELADDKSLLDLPSGTVLQAASFTTNGVHLAKGTYVGAGGTGGKVLPQLSPGVTIGVPEHSDVETVEATWTGAAETASQDKKFSTADNWENSTLPNLTEGSLLAKFAAGGTEAVIDTYANLKGIGFTGAKTPFAVSSANGASADIWEKGITAAGSGTYTISAPLNLRAGQEWAVSGTLNLNGPIDSTDIHSITRTGTGTLNIYGTNTFSGSVSLMDGKTYVYSKKQPFGVSENGSSVSVRLDLTDTSYFYLEGAVVDKPVSITSPGKASKNRCVFEGPAGCTNTFTAPVTILGAKLELRGPNFSRPTVFSGGISGQHYFFTENAGPWIIRDVPAKLTGSMDLKTNMSLECPSNRIGSVYMYSCRIDMRAQYALCQDDGINIASDNTVVFDLHGYDQKIGLLSGFNANSSVTSDAPAKLFVTTSSATTYAGRFLGFAGLSHGGAQTTTVTSQNVTAGELEVTSGTVKFDAGATWQPTTKQLGKESKLTMKGGTLTLTDTGVFSPQATVTLDGGTLKIPAGQTMTCHTLVIGGKTYNSGTWGAEGTAGADHFTPRISGGLLKVTGAPGLILMVR